MKKIILPIILHLFFVGQSFAQTVTTIVGPNSGINDGLVLDSVGNIYGSDFGSSSTGASSVYKINTAGVISTFSTGYSSCNGLAFDHNNNLFVVDFTSNNNTHQIYKLDSLGNKTPYGPNVPGASGIIFDPLSDTLYVSQYNGTGSNQISKLSSDGNVTLHSNHALLNGPVGMAFDSNNILYVANFNDGEIYKVTNNGDSLTLIANIPNVSFWGVGFITYANGYLYATGIGTHKIYKISLTGMVTDFAGTGTAGLVDGPANIAQFNRPNGIATNFNQDKLYVSDLNSRSVREISFLLTNINNHKDISNVELYQNFPNPANNLTEISYSLSKYSNVQLQLFSKEGKLLTTLLSLKQPEGTHSYILKTAPYKSGLYYYRLVCDDYSITKKIIVIH